MKATTTKKDRVLKGFHVENNVTFFFTLYLDPWSKAGPTTERKLRCVPKMVKFTGSAYYCASYSAKYNTADRMVATVRSRLPDAS